MIENNLNYNNNILKIKSFIKGGFLVFLGRKDIKILAEQIFMDEEIIYAAIGSLDDVLGMFTITDRRILFAAEVINEKNTKTTSIYHEDITEISLIGPAIFNTGKKIRISGKNIDFIIKAKKEEALSLKRNIEIQVSKKKQGSNTGSCSLDIEKELVKYKSLLEKGLITEEEFTAKKKQILGL